MLTLKEAAEVLGCSPSGLRKLIRQGAIRYFQIGKHSTIRFRREWLDDFIDLHSVIPGVGSQTPATHGETKSALPAWA